MLLVEVHEGASAEALPLKQDVLLLRQLPRGGKVHREPVEVLGSRSDPRVHHLHVVGLAPLGTGDRRVGFLQLGSDPIVEIQLGLSFSSNRDIKKIEKNEYFPRNITL